MLHTLLNKLFSRKPQPMNEATLDAMVAAARTEMARPQETEGAKSKMGRPREHAFYDLKVGESYRIPVRERTNTRVRAYNYARVSGKKFTTRTTKNGVWVKRIA